MENKLKWQNIQLNPEESFKKGEYEALIEYVKQNEHALLSSLCNDDDCTVGLTLKYGHSKMIYFEKIIEANPDTMLYALFKLGELKGHLDAIGKIRYEYQCQSIAMRDFSNFKAHYPDYATLSETIIKKLLEGSPLTVDELTKTLNVKKGLIKDTLLMLFWTGLLDCREYAHKVHYVLTEKGSRVAKELKKS